SARRAEREQPGPAARAVGGLGRGRRRAGGARGGGGRRRGRRGVMTSHLDLTAPPRGRGAEYEGDGGGVITTSVDQTVNWLLNWGRSNSVWYMLFGLACCAIELMQTGGPRGDLERFGAAPRPSPRSSDLFIIAGTLTYKMAT